MIYFFTSFLFFVCFVYYYYKNKRVSCLVGYSKTFHENYFLLGCLIISYIPIINLIFISLLYYYINKE